MVEFAGLADIVTFIVGPFADTYTKLHEFKVDHIDVRTLVSTPQLYARHQMLISCSDLMAFRHSSSTTVGPSIWPTSSALKKEAGSDR